MEYQHDHAMKILLVGELSASLKNNFPDSLIVCPIWRMVGGSVGACAGSEENSHWVHKYYLLTFKSWWDGVNEGISLCTCSLPLTRSEWIEAKGLRTWTVKAILMSKILNVMWDSRGSALEVFWYGEKPEVTLIMTLFVRPTVPYWLLDYGYRWTSLSFDSSFTDIQEPTLLTFRYPLECWQWASALRAGL